MKFTLSWLKTHLDTSASVAEVAEAMTMAGLEVEQVEDPAAKLAAFSVAKVLQAKPHPNADRLTVCQAETKDGIKEIVCGAPNARAGLTTVVLCPAGAIALAKLAQSRAVGARVLEGRGSFDEALTSCLELVERGTHVLVNSLNPNRIEGQKTAAFEIDEALGRAPDVIALP